MYTYMYTCMLVCYIHCTSATMNRKAVTEATRLVKSGSRAMPRRKTKNAEKWNHFLIHIEDGLKKKEDA